MVDPPLFDRRKSCHYKNKAELRLHRRQHAAKKSDHLTGKILNKDYIDFWRDWKRASQVKSPPVNRINEAVTEPDIVNTFQSYFQQIYGDDSTVAHGKLRDAFMERLPLYFASGRYYSIAPYLLSWEDVCNSG